MPPSYMAVFLLSLLSCATTCAGVWLAAVIGDNARAIAMGIGFSTGLMLVVSALELVPETYVDIGAIGALLSTGLGAAVLWLANLAISHSHLVREHGHLDTRLVKSVYLVVIGLVLHDVPEGFAMANAYVASPSLGLLVALAIALHNVPEELAMAVPAMTFRSRRFLIRAAVLSALAEPAGAVLDLVAVDVRPALNAYFMAFAAGAMVFVALHELAPMARRYGKLGWFVAGLALSVAAHQFLALAIGG
jgi:ZIP family zinc transporter